MLGENRVGLDFVNICFIYNNKFLTGFYLLISTPFVILQPNFVLLPTLQPLKLLFFTRLKFLIKSTEKIFLVHHIFSCHFFFSPILVIFLHPLNQFLAPSLHFPNLRLSNLCLIAFVDVIIPLILHNFFSKNPRTI